MFLMKIIIFYVMLFDVESLCRTNEDEDAIDKTGSSTNEEAIKNYESDESVSESTSLISNGSEEYFKRDVILDIDCRT